MQVSVRTASPLPNPPLQAGEGVLSGHASLVRCLEFGHCNRVPSPGPGEGQGGGLFPRTP
jgi:hypothetical protein